MKRIGIERDKARGSAGLIEGETDTGQRWIMFLDEQGRPEVFWPNREADGAIIGAPIGLQDPRIVKFLEIMSDPDPVARATRLKEAAEAALKMLNEDGLTNGEQMVSTFPVFTPETWPRKPGDDPTDYTGLQRGVVFCVAQEGQNPAQAMRAFVRELNEFYDAEEALDGE